MRVVLAPNARGWSYDFTAVALTHELRDRFDISIAYGPNELADVADEADVIVDFWWRGGLDQQYGYRVVKQVSSHRWQRKKYGHMPAALVARRHLARAGAVVVPSVRLHALMSEGLRAIGSRQAVSVAPKGFDPALFSPASRSGALRIGWAGNARGADKRVKMLREACPELVTIGPRTELGSVAYEQMPGFYNSIDVITCASDAEGDPRPLIEGMACGCFPVMTDVGIARELIRHGQNGLIVEQSVDAFSRAFMWCRANLDFVRARGRENAEQMLATRTWARCAPAWGDAFEAVYAKRYEVPCL